MKPSASRSSTDPKPSTPWTPSTLKRFPVLGAYELALKCSQLFNLLDARGAISVTERVGVMARIRTLVVGVAKAYSAQQASISAGSVNA